jgi:hypothetical protein
LFGREPRLLAIVICYKVTLFYNFGFLEKFVGLIFLAKTQRTPRKTILFVHDANGPVLRQRSAFFPKTSSVIFYFLSVLCAFARKLILRIFLSLRRKEREEKQFYSSSMRVIPCFVNDPISENLFRCFFISFACFAPLRENLY